VDRIKDLKQKFSSARFLGVFMNFKGVISAANSCDADERTKSQGLSPGDLARNEYCPDLVRSLKRRRRDVKKWLLLNDRHSS